MLELFIPISTAFWLGILTSISPCPLATNITAVSYIGQKVKTPRKVFLAGVLYTTGRMLTYMLLGALLVSSMLSAPSLSHILQKYMNMFLGPILIFTGMVLLGLIELNLKRTKLGETLREKADTGNLGGAVLLGVLFALSFCPTSAALFFGSLLPLALKQQSGIVLPAAYGIATGVPVLLFTIVLTTGASKLSEIFNAVTAIEKWARRVTGTIFIAVGIYYALTHVFKIF